MGFRVEREGLRTVTTAAAITSTSKVIWGLK